MASFFKGHSSTRYQCVDSEKQFSDDVSDSTIQPVQYLYQRKTHWVVNVLLAISVLLNIILAFYTGFFSHAIKKDAEQVEIHHHNELDRSKFAGLVYDQPFEWRNTDPLENTDFKSANKTWQESVDIDPGVVALHRTYAENMGLPPSSTFPWADGKDIYYINGFHDLHCVKSLHMAISEYALGHPQTYEKHHVTHCLRALKETVMCHADDTPRYTLVKPEPENHPTQARMCRSWDKLVEWARPLTACYKYINEDAKRLDSHERYKFCPEGSDELERVRAYWLENFGKNVGW